MTQLRKLSQGHALSQGRLSIGMEDISQLIQTVMSTASAERVRIFELLLTSNGVLTTTQICTFLEVSKPTALRTMTELKVAGLVDIPYEEGYNVETLKPKFKWFLTKEFGQLKDKQEEDLLRKIPPTHGGDVGQREEQERDAPQNVEQDSDVRGGDFSLHSPKEPNGGNYAMPRL